VAAVDSEFAADEEDSEWSDEDEVILLPSRSSARTRLNFLHVDMGCI